MQPIILYETNEVLAIDKPAGLLVHVVNTATNQPTVVDWLIERAPAINHLSWPDPTRPGIVHRLDRDTSGVMLLAKTPTDLADLQQQFAERAITKHYLTLVSGAPSWEETTVRAVVSRSEGTKRRAHFLRLPDDQGKEAETLFLKRDSWSVHGHLVSLIEAQPKTGRTHQIRVHLDLAGYPILGDPWYETKASRAVTKQLGIKRLMLHAQSITFILPGSDKQVTVTAPLAPDFDEVIKSLETNVDKTS